MKPTDFPTNGRDWEARRYADFDISPNRRGARHRLSGQRRQLADEGRQLQRRRRRHDPLHRAFPAHASVRLPGADARRRGRRLADRLLDARAVLRRERPHDGRRRAWRAIPAYPPHEPADAAAPARQDRHALRAGAEQARLALVAVRQRHRHRRDYEGRAQCINLGHCTPGCAQGAKASTDITYWPLALRAGVELRTRCRVREITTDEHGMAAGAIYYDAEGAEQFQPAEVVIVACNGVGTPRLLLNSRSARFPDGLANSIGPGRQEPDVPSLAAWSPATSTRRWTATAGPTAGAVEQGVLRDRPSRGFVRGYTLQFAAASARSTRRSQRLAPAGCPGARDHHRAYRALLRAPAADRRRLRGPAGGAQPRHARSRCSRTATASPRRGSTTRSARTRSA